MPVAPRLFLVHSKRDEQIHSTLLVRENRIRRRAFPFVIHLHKSACMNSSFLKISILLFLVPAFVNGQAGSTSLTSDTIPTPGSLTGESLKSNSIHGFVRGGFYGSIDDADNRPYVSSSFADFGLKVESEDGHRFKALTDLRFRYGTEFLEPVSRFEIVEAYVTANGKKWDLSMGQKIIKWGRADFTNPTSKLNPQNLVSRSPDHSDMDLGNLLSSYNTILSIIKPAY
jgi:hypothetical protein